MVSLCSKWVSLDSYVVNTEDEPCHGFHYHPQRVNESFCRGEDRSSGRLDLHSKLWSNSGRGWHSWRLFSGDKLLTDHNNLRLHSERRAFLNSRNRLRAQLRLGPASYRCPNPQTKRGRRYAAEGDPGVLLWCVELGICLFSSLSASLQLRLLAVFPIASQERYLTLVFSYLLARIYANISG